jgi:hypothetical protein
MTRNINKQQPTKEEVQLGGGAGAVHEGIMAVYVCVCLVSG